jgi:hypothetical protein
MKKVKKFAMGGMNFNSSSRKAPPPPPVMAPRPLPAGSGLKGMAAPTVQAGQNLPGGKPMQTPNTGGTPAGLASGAPVGLAAMGGGAGLSPAQLSGLRNNLGPQAAPANAAAIMNDIHTGIGSRPSSVGGMKKGGKVSSASKRADGCAIKGKTRGKMM